MALVKCPDCGKDFSDAAPACPNCGRPRAPVRATAVATPRRSFGCAAQTIIAIGAVIIFGMLRSSCAGSKDGPAPTALPGPMPSTPRALDNSELQASAQIQIRGQLRDPESAKFHDVTVHVSNAGMVATCGYVNAKNGFGGYGGDTRFVVMGSIALLDSDEHAASFSKAWKTACVQAKVR